jgi:hypothetical protein
MSGRSRAVALAAGIGAGAALAASGALARPAAFLLGLLRPRVAAVASGGGLVPLNARLLGIYAGLALALICAGFLWRRRLRRRPDFNFLATRRGKLLFGLLVVLALLTLSLSINRAFWDDEIEHVHAAWYVHNGQVPFRDFFEHHHPLLWFLLAPLLSLLGEGLAVLAAARLLMLLMAAAIAWLTWRIARRAGGDAEAGLLAVAILFANFMFMPCVMEVRPDVPMLLLALAAVERLLAHAREGRLRQLLAAAFLASLSFLFLQKSLFLVAAMIAWLVGRAWRGQVRPALLAAAAGAFVTPLLAFGAWLALNNAWGDYLLCNWLLNLERTGSGQWPVILRLALVNLAFWAAVPPALLRSWRTRKADSAAGALVLFALAALAAPALSSSVGDRYFLLPLPLLSVGVALWLHERLGGGAAVAATGARRPLAALLLMTVLPLPFLFSLAFPLNGAQLEKLTYVLRLSRPGEKVLDGRNDFNLFRPDVHYFWFQTGPGEMQEAYRRLRGGPRAAYDPCRLVREQEPRFIGFSQRDWAACQFWRAYVPTPFAGLFRRERR